ncbi:MAG: rhomboid family intramembrane serine protease [Verrucomicrobia bacterium]|nr:rhomboid family intramembrane serine protease [Verrucomicrobiota bacterium]
MRLVGTIKTEKEAYGFHVFLLKQNVQNVYESFKDPATNQTAYHIWVVDEDDFDKAQQYLREFEAAPTEARFQHVKEEKLKGPVIAPTAPRIPRRPFVLTNLFILICSLLFFLDLMQREKIAEKQGEVVAELSLTPIQQNLLFDYPQYLVDMEKFFENHPIASWDDFKKLPPDVEADYKKVEQEPTWKGLTELVVTRSMKDYSDIPPGTLFGKIRQGEIWRLFTPVLLHAGLLHILFNMAWLWILGRQIEARLSFPKMALLILIIGVLSNIVQYLMGGPTFLGFSGIVVGLVGFIWMRQKMAPWEGYPLQRSVILFIVIFVLAMMALELVSLSLQFFHLVQLSANIANSAHIAGGIIGILLARLRFFSRRSK